MKKNSTALNFNSSFLSCEKDAELILKKLFIQSGQNSDILKKLLVINTKDCLEDKHKDIYDKEIAKFSLAELFDKGYIRIVPQLKFGEHEDVKAYILITFDNFSETDNNPEYINRTITFDVFCQPESWDIGNYRVRPMKICGYIDGLLRNEKLTGIGTLRFGGCNLLLVNEELCGYSLTYLAVNGSDDKIEPETL